MCQLNNSQCRIGAASLFSHPGQASVIPECDLKNVTIFSDASYMHWEKKKKKRKEKAFGFTGSAFLSGLCTGVKIQYRFGRRSHSSLNEPLYRTLTLSHLTGKKGKNPEV